MKKSDKILVFLGFLGINVVAVFLLAKFLSVGAAVLAATLVAVFVALDTGLRFRNLNFEKSKNEKLKKETEERQRVREEERLKAQQKKEEAVKKQRMREHSSYRRRK